MFVNITLSKLILFLADEDVIHTSCLGNIHFQEIKFLVYN